MLKEAEERHQREKDFVRLRLWDWGSWKRWVGSGLAHSHVCMGKVGAWPEQGTVSSDTSQRAGHFRGFWFVWQKTHTQPFGASDEV